MKYGSYLVALSLSLLSLSACVMGNSRGPVGRSSTTGGVVCPSGYEPTRSGECVLLPNNSSTNDQFR